MICCIAKSSHQVASDLMRILLPFTCVSSIVLRAPWFLMQIVAVLIAFLVSAIFHEV